MSTTGGRSELPRTRTFGDIVGGGRRDLVDDLRAAAQANPGTLPVESDAAASAVREEASAATPLERIQRETRIIGEADTLGEELRRSPRELTPREQRVFQQAAQIRAESRLSALAPRETAVASGGGQEVEKRVNRKQVFFANWRRVKKQGEQGPGELRLVELEEAQWPDLNRKMEIVIPQEVGAGDVLVIPLPGRERGLGYYPVTRMPKRSEIQDNPMAKAESELPPPILTKEHRKLYERQEALRREARARLAPVVTQEMYDHAVFVSRAIEPEEVELMKQGLYMDRESGAVKPLPELRIPRIIPVELPDDLKRLVTEEAARVQINALRKPELPGKVA